MKDSETSQKAYISLPLGSHLQMRSPNTIISHLKKKEKKKYK